MLHNLFLVVLQVRKERMSQVYVSLQGTTIGQTQGIPLALVTIAMAASNGQHIAGVGYPIYGQEVGMGPLARHASMTSSRRMDGIAT